MTLKEGDSYSLVCNATGNPPPTVDWQFVLPDTDILEFKFIPPGNMLSFDHITVYDTGTYVCIAKVDTNYDRFNSLDIQEVTINVGMFICSHVTILTLIYPLTAKPQYITMTTVSLRASSRNC